MKIPKEYLPVMPYIITENARGFLDFTKAVFGATEQLVVQGNGDRDIMHCEIRIFDAVIMFADKPENFDTRPCGMFIYVDDVDSLYGKAIAHGAKSLMTPMRQDYGYTAGFEDVYRNQWWIVEAEKE